MIIQAHVLLLVYIALCVCNACVHFMSDGLCRESDEQCIKLMIFVIMTVYLFQFTSLLVIAFHDNSAFLVQSGGNLWLFFGYPDGGGCGTSMLAKIGKLTVRVTGLSEMA